MKLSKAIQIGILMHKEKVYLLDTDGDDALYVLIEAGKWVELIRPTLPAISHKLLPGETEK